MKTHRSLFDCTYVTKVKNILVIRIIVKIELNAERKVLDDTRLRVMFKETAFYIFGNEVKRGEVKGAGAWDYIYSGTVNVDGEKMLLRVLKTPSTFVIAQKE